METILLVEDDASEQRAIARVLKTRGWMPLQLLREQGYRLPAAVKARFKGKSSRQYRLQCGLAAYALTVRAGQPMQPANRSRGATIYLASLDAPDDTCCSRSETYNKSSSGGLGQLWHGLR